MRVLIVDTATEYGFAAVVDEKGNIQIERLSAGLHSSKELMPAIDKLVQEGRVDRIIAGVGPGSYTGMRVTASVASLISFAKKIPLVGVSSLLAYFPAQEGRFFTLFDARQGGVYLIEGEKRGETIAWKEPENVSLEKCLERIEGVDLLLTPHARLQERLGLSLQVILPHPLEMFKEGMKQKAPGIGHLKLLYLREHPATG